jgi:hypothetical protein
VQLRTSVDVVSTPAVYNIWDITPEILAEYPYISFAFLETYVDNSENDTPNRSNVNQYSQFGISPNVEFDIPNIENFQIDYAVFKSIINNAIPIWGMNTISFNEGSNIINIGLCDEDDIYVYSNGVVCAREYTDDMKEYLIRQAACLGLFVRIANDSELDTSVIPLDNNDVILGVLDDYEVGHGDYTRGAENRENKIWNWTTNRDSNYDPYAPPIPSDPTHYDDTTVFGTVGIFNTFVKYYALNDTQLSRLCNSVYTYIDSIDTNTEDITQAITKTFYTNNPLDVILTLKKFPFNIGAYVQNMGSLENIRLGNLDTGTQGIKIVGSYTVVDLGSYPCYPYFGNCFLDYSPYTYYDLIVPFCGSIRLDPAQFMGHTLRLKMAIDLYTGACTCYILSDNLCIDSISGNCSIDIPVTGIQSADFQNSMQNAITNVKNARLDSAAFNMRGNLAMGPVWTGQIGGSGILKNSAFATAGNFISSLGTSLSNALNVGGNAVSAEKTAAQNSINLSKAEYDLQHLETPFSMVGSQSAANSFTEETQARLIIYRPIFAEGYDPTIYADSYGFATLENDTLNKYSGFTVAKINLEGVRCSEEEKTMIESLFTQGVYL